MPHRLPAVGLLLVIFAKTSSPNHSGKCLTFVRAEVPRIHSKSQRTRQKVSSRHTFTQSKILRPNHELTMFHNMLADFITPGTCGKLPTDIGTPAGGSLSADQWLLLATVYGPIIVPQIWGAYLLHNATDEALCRCVSTIERAEAEKQQEVVCKANNKASLAEAKKRGKDAFETEKAWIGQSPHPTSKRTTDRHPRFRQQSLQIGARHRGVLAEANHKRLCRIQPQHRMRRQCMALRPLHPPYHLQDSHCPHPYPPSAPAPIPTLMPAAALAPPTVVHYRTERQTKLDSFTMALPWHHHTDDNGPPPQYSINGQCHRHLYDDTDPPPQYSNASGLQCRSSPPTWEPMNDTSQQRGTTETTTMALGVSGTIMLHGVTTTIRAAGCQQHDDAKWQR
ncbi:hypothetical protein SCLCIDRAFT_11799 [Scleroderma citrinum Foug A]|uniref:Uncharacterized protein n=1 Tax=Scleroderma citrinum Foug A TaxID=1036808 RepID=A0A0C3D8F5_9AGAM|nr:hypothetical protein SCLCIDRAFT_11799 [Scleroderma citrinum Foug A]